MRKIGSKADCEKLWGLPPPVYQRIEETIALLNYHYGENRNIDKDLGGYVLVIEDNQDFDKFKKTFSKEVSNITVEYSDIIFWEDKPSHTASLFLVSSDFSVLLIIPYSLTPTAFFSDNKRDKEV